MKKQFEIRLLPGLSSDVVIVHRFRNFGEDIYRDIEMMGLGVASDIDAATEEIKVTVTSKRHIGTVKDKIRRLIQQHKFMDQIEVR